jgi:hypothetical protein
MIYTKATMDAELQWLAAHSKHVLLDEARARDVAQVIGRQVASRAAFQTDPGHSPNQTLPENNADTLQFYLVTTSQHFCIWRRTAGNDVQAWDIEIDGSRYTGARGINAAHVRALREGKNILDPAYLASMTLADIEELYRDERDGRTDLQLLPQRLAKLNEIGRVLQARFGGQAVNLLAEAGAHLFREDGHGLVQLLLLHFPVAYFDWPFNKLAILLGKLLMLRNHSAVPTTSQFQALTAFQDPEHFEIAADYYIPLFFIRTGVFRISEELSQRLRTRQLIERNSRMERDYRACTMMAGRLIAAETNLSIPAIDEELWQSGFLRCRLCRIGVSDEELPCPYREHSVAYQSEHELMELAWPLVLTPCY